MAVSRKTATTYATTEETQGRASCHPQYGKTLLTALYTRPPSTECRVRTGLPTSALIPVALSEKQPLAPSPHAGSTGCQTSLFTLPTG